MKLQSLLIEVIADAFQAGVEGSDLVLWLINPKRPQQVPKTSPRRPQRLPGGFQNRSKNRPETLSEIELSYVRGFEAPVLCLPIFQSWIRPNTQITSPEKQKLC